MNRIPLAALVLVVLPFGAAARAQAPDTLPWFHAPPIVVTATRGESPADRVGSAISVVGRAEIERRGHRTALDALREMPGVLVAQAGGAGGVASVFLRGAAAHQTLVLVDGVAVNDPSSPTGAYDFAHLPAADVERIEVLRGPQSTLYGSSAMSGVIQVVTRRGNGPPRLAVEVEGGSSASHRLAARGSGSADRLSGYASLERRHTDGTSTTAARLGGLEADGATSTAFAGRLDWDGGAVGVGLVVRARRDETDLDQGGFTGGDDPNFAGEAGEDVARLEARGSFMSGRWRPTVAVGIARHDRTTRDEPDPGRPLDRSTGEFRGHRTRLEWVNRIDLAGGRTTAGVETEEERASSTFESEGEFGPFASELPEVDARTTGAFLQHEADFGDRLRIAVGGRLDDHDRFGSAGTWRVTGSLALGERTRLRGSHGTGFQAPTLFQLFDPEFGSAGLDPERSRGWDVGLERELGTDRARVSATWFSTGFEESIAFEFPDGYRNMGRTSARGLEAAASLRPSNDWTLTASWTHTRTEDESGGPDDGRPLLRRPRNAGQLTAAWDPGALGLAVTARFVGEREDLDFAAFPAERVELDSFVVLRLAASWEASEWVRLFGRAENLTDESYEEVLGFGAPGRSVHVGVGVDLF